MTACPWGPDIVRAVAARAALGMDETAGMLADFGRKLAAAEAAERNDETPTGETAAPPAADEGSNSHHPTGKKLP